MPIHNREKCKGECYGLCCTKIENFGVTRGTVSILENVNIHIHCGELTAVIGPNGAGKSTLLKALLGEIQHTGELKYLDSKGSRSGKPLIGYVPQQLSFDTGTPASVLDLFIACRSKAPAWIFKPAGIRKRAIEGLSKVRAEHLIDRRLGALSGGELQRVLLALALDPVPNLLLLDEPSSGIDQGGLELFYNTVSELRRKFDLSIILVSHDLELVAKHADRVIMLNRTVISNGTPEQVFSDEKAMKSFGVSSFLPGFGGIGRESRNENRSSECKCDDKGDSSLGCRNDSTSKCSFECKCDDAKKRSRADKFINDAKSSNDDNCEDDDNSGNSDKCNMEGKYDKVGKCSMEDSIEGCNTEKGRED